MPRPKPPFPIPVRLTLSGEAFKAVTQGNGPLKIRAGVKRTDGRWDCLITGSAYDQLQTASLPRENLSDTVLRLKAYSKGTA